jgi:hypothetical protein
MRCPFETLREIQGLLASLGPPWVSPDGVGSLMSAHRGESVIAVAVR